MEISQAAAVKIIEILKDRAETLNEMQRILEKGKRRSKEMEEAIKDIKVDWRKEKEEKKLVEAEKESKAKMEGEDAVTSEKEEDENGVEIEVKEAYVKVEVAEEKEFQVNEIEGEKVKNEQGEPGFIEDGVVEQTAVMGSANKLREEAETTLIIDESTIFKNSLDFMSLVDQKVGVNREATHGKETWMVKGRNHLQCWVLTAKKGKNVQGREEIKWVLDRVKLIGWGRSPKHLDGKPLFGPYVMFLSLAQLTPLDQSIFTQQSLVAPFLNSTNTYRNLLARTHRKKGGRKSLFLSRALNHPKDLTHVFNVNTARSSGFKFALGHDWVSDLGICAHLASLFMCTGLLGKIYWVIKIFGGIHRRDHRTVRWVYKEGVGSYLNGTLLYPREFSCFLIAGAMRRIEIKEFFYLFETIKTRRRETREFFGHSRMFWANIRVGNQQIRLTQSLFMDGDGGSSEDENYLAKSQSAALILKHKGERFVFLWHEISAATVSVFMLQMDSDRESEAPSAIYLIFIILLLAHCFGKGLWTDGTYGLVRISGVLGELNTCSDKTIGILKALKHYTLTPLPNEVTITCNLVRVCDKVQSRRAWEIKEAFLLSQLKLNQKNPFELDYTKLTWHS